MILHAQKQNRDFYRHLDDKRIYFRQVLLLHSGGNTVFQKSERPGLQILFLLQGFFKNLTQFSILRMCHK